jgi:hypothetical protein
MINYSVISLEDDFARMAVSHSWYKHLPLGGRWFTMSLEYGYYPRYSSSIQDEGNLHWCFNHTYMEDDPDADSDADPLNVYRVKLNYCLIYANVINNPNYSLLEWPWCLFDNPNNIQKINKLIREKYPHLSPVELMDGDDYPPAITEPILAFLKAEYEDMFFQVIEVANRYYARNLTLV